MKSKRNGEKIAKIMAERLEEAMRVRKISQTELSQKTGASKPLFPVVAQCFCVISQFFARHDKKADNGNRTRITSLCHIHIRPFRVAFV